MNNQTHDKTTGWGVKTDDGTEIWDAPPVFTGEFVSWKDRLKLIFYPKKFVLYRAIAKDIQKKNIGDLRDPYRILDVGSGTGAAVIDLKKLFGRHVEVVGADVMRLQNDLARENLKKYGVHADIVDYETVLPFVDNTFDAVYTSDVLGHVPDVDAWLHELNRVLVSGGLLAMFSESKLGKHAWIRNYLMKRGMNTDPHAEFHISLYSKDELKEKIDNAGFVMYTLLSAVWATFFVHPDEMYVALQSSKKFFILRTLNKWLYFLKKKTHPFSTAAAELYSLLELVTLGRFVESQGYVVLARKQSKQ
ncbi:MAG: Methyltransferase type 12 [Candidatus Magasanikbacteria bacterium GW2011_GWD2_43_18]|uniref:Methyltransferase type 12 n=1 Tax=Candidatus Magasanikbacteria bacterium GW2011_GWE2_42_7 TaxID=1619052 RepID=A0A0G1BC94_9BACT|nr:MAG: Methyltransferase type 12 [Candidatus Magasanikbacteria bacterium GW2011_GWC2_42_27]KKS70995.1 MAG: Methyltransferase type 12 [Candidatus Magasanikbacteria bacterium GW2011_GWE2_42_7]KKT05279.1 MAG: Methyltransferase type 12 [Candidatus Magasanikbacteria bacterium GW2011_GWD2_43_18]KKT26099.1 MAG: Methyltransferase type 12 [Candidatus Magasanikbacteria bacterium GW2011_GWA2_43_9]